MNRTTEPEAAAIDLDAANARVNAVLHPQDRPTPEQAEAALEAIQKRSRMTVPKLLARYQDRREEVLAVIANIDAQETALKTERIHANAELTVWKMAIAEIERGEA